MIVCVVRRTVNSAVNSAMKDDCGSMLITRMNRCSKELDRMQISTPAIHLSCCHRQRTDRWWCWCRSSRRRLASPRTARSPLQANQAIHP